MLLVGLGNPGPEYALSRHNVGFWALDRISKAHRIVVRSPRHHSLVGRGVIGGCPALLAKPQTYMNLSGKAVRALLRAEGLGAESLIVLHDDMDIPLGKVKLKTTGGDAGHNGIASIIESLGMRDFRRLRIGLGRPPEEVEDRADWLLSPFLDSELEVIEEGIDRVADRAVALVREGARGNA
ncbi:MAG: aminoacyl-tRNA hydrolase [Nitrospinota bacterium]